MAILGKNGICMNLDVIKDLYFFKRDTGINYVMSFNGYMSPVMFESAIGNYEIEITALIMPIDCKELTD